MKCNKCNNIMVNIQNTIYLCEICNSTIPVHTNNYSIGPGYELKNILYKIGIDTKEGCNCKQHANYMDEMESKEPGWCEKNISTIIGWLREESEKRGLPFIEIIARGIVKLAIKRAKKKIK